MPDLRARPCPSGAGGKENEVLTPEQREQLADDLGYQRYRCPRHGQFYSDVGPHCPTCDEVEAAKEPEESEEDEWSC